MSKGSGRVERAIRAMIEHHGKRRGFTSDYIIHAAFGTPPKGKTWTPSQRRSALRAMHRIVDDQPGWTVKIRHRHRVMFTFDPVALVPYVSSGPGALESLQARRKALRLNPADRLMKRPKPIRQKARDRADRARWKVWAAGGFDKMPSEDFDIIADEPLDDRYAEILRLPYGMTFGAVRKRLRAAVG